MDGSQEQLLEVTACNGVKMIKKSFLVKLMHTMIPYGIIFVHDL